MKTIIVLIFLVTNAFAWEIVSREETTFLQDEKLKIKEEIISHPTLKKIEKKELSDDVVLVTYLENLGGTKTSSESYNCAAFSKKSKKLIFKDLACRSILTDQNGKKEIEEASFKIEGSSLLYHFDELKKKFDLPK